MVEEAAPVRRPVRLGIVAAAIVAMVATIVILQSIEEEPETAPEPTFTADDPDRVLLLDNPRDEIARIVIQREDGELAVRQHEDNRFRPVYEHDVAWNNSAVNRIVSGATSMSSRRVIGEVDDLADYGLSDPSAVVIVERTDGSQVRLSIGDRTPARDGFYVRRTDDPNVYSVFDTWITPFFQDMNQLRIRSIPQIALDRPERFVVETLEERTIRAERRPEWDEDPEMGFSSFAVYEPFRRRYQLNTNWIEDLTEQVQGLRIERFVDDAPADLSDYGLDPPRARFLFADRDNRELEMLVGSEAEGGRYAKFPDRPSVFVLSGTEPIITVRPYRTVSAFALIVNIDLVDSFEVETVDERFVGRIEREEIEGEEFPEEIYYLDGVEIEESAFKRLYQWAIGLMFDLEIPRDRTVAVGAREPIATIRYHLNTGSDPLVVSFEPYDANYAMVVRDGDAEFLIARSKLRRMLTAFREAS